MAEDSGEKKIPTGPLMKRILEEQGRHDEIIHGMGTKPLFDKVSTAPQTRSETQNRLLKQHLRDEELEEKAKKEGFMVCFFGVGDPVNVIVPDPDNPRKDKAFHIYLSKKLPIGALISIEGSHYLVREPLNKTLITSKPAETTFVEFVKPDHYSEALRNHMEYSVLRGNLPLSENPKNDYFKRNLKKE